MAVNIEDYVAKLWLRQLFGGKTATEKETQKLNLELKKITLERAKDPHTIPTINARLEAMANKFDLTTDEGLESAINAVGTSIDAGMFGTNEFNIQYAKDFKQGLVTGSTLNTEVSKLKNELSTSVRYSNLDATLKNAFMFNNGSKSIKFLEEFAYDLNTKRDRLEKLGNLNPAIDKRYQNAIQKINQSIQEFGGDGLTEKEWGRIKTNTYATIKQAEANLEQEFTAIDKIREFKSPTLKDDQLLNSLTKIHEAINTFDDYSAQQGNKFLYSGMIQSQVAGTPSPQMDELSSDIANLEIFRDDRVLKQYAESYQKIFDLYVKNRKDNKGKFQLSDFREIMDSSLHEELYSYPTSHNKKVPDNNFNSGTQFNPYPPNKSTEKNLINNMFSKRNITFTNDIVDEHGNIWMQKDKTLEGMGKSDKDSWQIKSINRTDTDELKNIVLEIPNYDKTISTSRLIGLAPTQTTSIPTRKTVTLAPDDFILEDDPSFAGPGYKGAGRWGLTSYNIFNNLYEQVK